MNKKCKALRTGGLAMIGLSLLWGLSACGGGSDATPQAVGQGGPTAAEASQLLATIQSLPVQTVSTAESNGLVWVREEEKLAHDIYALSATRWGLKVFTNIGSSETMHMDAMRVLLERYNLADPNAGLLPGQFQRAEFQQLHEQWAQKLNLGLIDAIQVGLEIEELDILDIEAEKALADNTDIRYAYDELLRGSRNHLRAFWKQLQAQGGQYTPSHISQSAFDAIASSPTETAPTPF